MPISVTEKLDSRATSGGRSSSHDREYIIRGTADEQEAITAMLNVAPQWYGDSIEAPPLLTRTSYSVEAVFIDEDNEAACIWGGSCKYATPSMINIAQGEDSYSFDTGGGTQHITQSLATILSIAAEGSPADTKGAIGDNGQGEIAGVDIVVPSYAFTETHIFDAGEVNQAYKLGVFNLTGRVNSLPFRGFGVREVLFQGASGQMRDGEEWEITFRFTAQRSQDFSINGMEGRKAGWDYLWILYKQDTDETAKRLAAVPQEVHVERVYEEGDFEALGIGTA